jgi:hypothetical protein
MKRLGSAGIAAAEIDRPGWAQARRACSLAARADRQRGIAVHDQIALEQAGPAHFQVRIHCIFTIL